MKISRATTQVRLQATADPAASKIWTADPRHWLRRHRRFSPGVSENFAEKGQFVVNPQLRHSSLHQL